MINYQGAIDDFSQVIQINPNYEEALKWRSVARYQLKDDDDFMNDQIKINKLEIPLRSLSDEIIKLCFEDLYGAIDSFIKVIEADPNNLEALKYRAQAYKKLSEIDLKIVKLNKP